MAGVSSNDPPAREESREGLDDTVPAKESHPADEPPQRPSRMSSPTTPPPPGEERYQIGAQPVELGRGGMGRVVEAYDVQLGRKVALKEVLPKAGNASARRFAREVALTARLEHPSIVPLYDSGTTNDGRPYYVMRRVTGRPLDELILRARRLDERLALLPAVQSAINAVAHAHNRGVIHRDLKPANILVGDLGETVVIDWGLAKVIGEEDDPASRDSLPSDSLQTQMGSVFGTPGFMAPEQARGEELGTHGDVYALGATLYQLLAGTPPHAGNSATEVIDKTLRHAMIPLAEIAPGAPAELVTIVNKALSPKPEERYPNAGALGEDLGRFLTGQLVAAHRYTPRQKLVRLARKHRGALSVAALALVGFAVFAWLSVTRIMHERDAANTARAAAIAGQRATEKANKELADRHDALLVSNARARMDLNPTEALATLKQLPAASSQLDEARAVAQASLLRGVTWAIQGTLEYTFIAEMSVDGRQLLQVSRDGMVRVWDLDRRRLVLARAFPPLTRAVWIAGGKLLVTHAKSSPVILDPVANTLDNLTIDPIDYAMPTEAGDLVAFSSPAGVGVLDVATRTTKIFAPGVAKPSSVELAPDGKTIGWVDNRTAVIADIEGHEIARVDKAARIEFSRARKVAVLANNKVLELDLDLVKPAFREVTPPTPRDDLVLDIVYRERELVAMVGWGTFWGWNGTRSYPRGQLHDLNAGMRIADTDYVLVLATDNKVHFMHTHMQGFMQLPANLLHPRMVSRRNSSLVLVVADGIILGFDLAAVRPRILHVTADSQADFVGDDTLLVTHSVQHDWEWLDIATGASTKLDFTPLMPTFISDNDGVGRVLVKEAFGPTGKISLLVKGETAARTIVEGEHSWARLVPGNAIIYSTGDAKVMAIVDNGPPREVAKLAGMTDGGVPIGHLEAAVHSTEGELVRIDLGTGKLSRTTIALGTRFLIQADPTGRVVLAEDKRVLMWDGQVTQLAAFDKPVVSLAMLQNAVAVSLRDNETFLLELRAGSTPVRVFAPGKTTPRASLDGRLVVSEGNAQQLAILELPSRTRWTVPPYFRMPGFEGPAVSPHSRRVLQHLNDLFVIWQLPHAPTTDFAPWLDDQTNATVDIDGELIWPWQAPNPKP